MKCDICETLTINPVMISFTRNREVIWFCESCIEKIKKKLFDRDQSQFEGMKICGWCGSGTFEPIDVVDEAIYCPACWKSFGNPQPVDKS